MKLSLPLAGLCLILLTACAGGGDRLHRLDSGLVGPDDFSALPSLPIELPPSTALPPPTPGGSNRTDRNPAGEAIAALGGSPSAAFAGGLPTSDQALLAFAGRNGTDPAIRQTLASEDAALRNRATLGGSFNLLGNDRYFPAYASQALDAYAELARLRSTGVRVPSAPPGN
jgi:hypothetical protein